MCLFRKLINHFIGNTFMWIYYGGKKSMNDVAKVDNSNLGFIIIVVLLLVVLGCRA